MLTTLQPIQPAKKSCVSVKANLVFILSLMLIGCNHSFAQTGHLDTSFDVGIGANDMVSTTAIQSNGKIIIGGNFTEYNGTTIIRIARLNPDGSLDTSFDPQTGPSSSIRTVSIQDNGKIIIGGPFTSYNGVERNRIARLNVNGSLDTSFDPGTGANHMVFASSIQNDGRIIIGGNFTSYNGIARNYIARLNSDGSLDSSFDPGLGANNTVSDISLQSDGKISISGIFTSYNGMARNTIARLNGDGSLDTSFDPGTGPNDWLYTNSIQSDGKIIIGGYFTSYNGIAINRIARLNTDGNLDTSFDPGTGASGLVESTSIQSDGKIVIGGEFASYNGTLRFGIARLNVDGSLDNSFDPGTGVGGYTIWTTSLQSDGKIIIGGNFTIYNGTAINRIARLNAFTTGIDQFAFENEEVKIFPNPLNHSATLQTEFELTNMALTIYNSSGHFVRQIPNVSGNSMILNLDDLPSGLYFIKLLKDKQVFMTKKLVITD